jgi:FkbM family methyltransferase
MLHEWLNKTVGYYIEAGCNDGVNQSNTLWLERIGWSGLLIEPNRHKLEICKKSRSQTNIFEQCALVSREYKEQFIHGNFDEQDSALSLTAQIDEILPDYDQHQAEAVLEKRSRPIIKVPARTLQSLIDDYHISTIDYLSLDVEGFEYQAMDGLDFGKNSPKIIQVETSTYEYRVNKMIKYLEAKGYECLGTPSPNAINDRIFRLR